MKPKNYFRAILQSPCKLAVLLSLPFTTIFVLLIITLMFWEKKSNENDLLAELRETARAYYEQILLIRFWNAQLGGIYAEVTEKTQPNPYLKDDPMRDIITLDGRRYTKINPAYMTRQISELANEKGKYRFKLTSLMPVNPQNAPDEWEALQLHRFEKKQKDEAYEIIKENGEERFRYMAPLITEAACLVCHKKHGYEKGDIRGGISIYIPMELPKAIRTTRAKQRIIIFGIIGLTTLSFIISITWLLSKKFMRNIEEEMEHKRLQAAIHLAGAAAHELRQPMTAIIGISELLDDKTADAESVKRYLDIVSQQCYRMDEIIKKMVKITKYKTKTYAEDTEIFDLEVQVEKFDKEEN